MEYLDSRMAVIADNTTAEPRERRVHPNDPHQRPDTWEGYLAFARKQRFTHDSEALHFAKKMWKESFVHFSTDMPEGQQ